MRFATSHIIHQSARASPGAGRNARWRDTRRSELVTVPSFSPHASAATRAAERTTGVTDPPLTLTFLMEGLVLGVGGLLVGNLLGLGISAYFTVRPFQLPGDLYFVTSLPVEVRITDLLGVNAMGLLTTLLAALIPARRAAGIEPARIIR